MSKNAHYSFDPIIVPGIILQQRFPIFFFFILNLIFVGRKKEKKIWKKPKSEVQIDLVLDYYWTMNAAVAEVSGPKGISEVHFLPPEVFLGQSLCRGGHLPCSLQPAYENYHYFIFSNPPTTESVKRNGLGPNNACSDPVSVT